ERLDRSPELAERQEAFFRKFLVEAGVSEADCKHVAQITKSDKSRQTASSGAVAKDVAEEYTRDNSFTTRKILLGDSCEICDVGKDIEDRGTADGEGRGP
nr:hypothetical protein [Tanacetum cinerariifolium]